MYPSYLDWNGWVRVKRPFMSSLLKMSFWTGIRVVWLALKLLALLSEPLTSVVEESEYNLPVKKRLLQLLNSGATLPRGWYSDKPRNDPKHTEEQTPC